LDGSQIAWAFMKLAVLVFSLCLHEFGHAYAANRLGDPTPRMLGRLTLDPRAHVDPIGTILFPLIMFLSPGLGSFLIGWAKPVPVTSENFKNPRRDDVIVSVAGPAANLFLFTLAMGLLWVLRVTGLLSGDLPPVVVQFLWSFALMNFFLAFFNLLPIPPLDGSWVVRSLLPGRLSYQYSKLYPYGNFIILGLLWTGILQYFFIPGQLLLGGILEVLGMGGIG
jgi:Zn-dependent protease